MNIYSRPYHYRDTVFHIQPTYNGYCVKVSYQLRIINQTSLSSLQEYETPAYQFANQAIRHAQGWVNRMLNDRDFTENRDTRLLDWVEAVGSVGISNEELDLAYWKGWSSNDEQLNNI